jgi:ATP-dependent DNA ligase
MQPRTKTIKKPKPVWLKPDALMDVECRALAGAKKVGHASFVGLREDP